MAGDYLLDTNIMIAILNEEKGIERHLKGVITFISSIVAGELYYGAYRSGRAKENLARLETFLADYQLLNCGKAIARQYGQVKDSLRAKGRPLPENDIWLAATALHHDLTLVTRDEHFNEVNGLKLARW